MRIRNLLLLSPVFWGSVASYANPNLSAGSASGVVLCAEHQIYAWGADSSGYGLKNFLGLDTTAVGYSLKKYYTTPQLVNNAGFNVKLTQIDAGSGFTFWGVSDKGILYSWGQTISDEEMSVYVSPTPVKSVAGLEGYKEDGTSGGKYIGNVKYVKGSTTGAIVLFNDGRALVSYTHFSDGKGKLVEDENGVVNDIVKISAGDNAFRVLRSDGRLYSMGYWNGNDTEGTTATPDDYTLKPLLLAETKKPLEHVIDMASGDVCAFALTRGGDLYGWGNDGWGGCAGTGTMASQKNARRVLSGAYKTISGEDYLTSVKKVAAGRAYGMAMTFDGHLLYWGNNDGNGGVIGNSSDNSFIKAPEFLVYEDGKVVDDAVDIIAGDNFAFVINKKGEYFAFGLNNEGQCGVGSDEKEIHYLHPFTMTCEVPAPCPSVTLGLRNTVELPEGSTLTAIVTAVDNEKYSLQWGHDGQLSDAGNNTKFAVREGGFYTVDLSSSRCGKVRDSVYVRISGDTSVVTAMGSNLSAGSANGVLLCNDHQVYVWGTDSSAYGVKNFLGIDTTVAGFERKKYYATPQLVNTNGVKLTQVDAGSGFAFWGVSDKGVLYSWGQASPGEEVTVFDVPTPMRSIAGLGGYNEDGTPGGNYIGNVKCVKGSTTGAIVLFNNGRALVSYNHLAKGDGRLVEDENGVVNDIVKISAGDNAFRVLRSDGRLYSMGDWNGNDTDLPTTPNTDYTLKPLLLAETKKPLERVIDMASGDVCAFALTKGGDLYGWGNDGWGGCTGTGTMASQKNARRVLSGDYRTISGEDYLTSVKKVAAGRGYGMAMTFDGHLLYWGNNDGDGGVMGNSSDYVYIYSPKFLEYKDGKVVDDAVDIIAGDNFGFVINKKGEYFTFGLNNEGQCGVGSDEKEIHYLHPFTLPCEMFDPCPSVSLGLKDTVELCPTGSVLTAIVTATDNDNYDLQWGYDGKLPNSTGEQFAVNGEGLYTVELDSRCGMSVDCVHVRFRDLGIVDLGDTSYVENPRDLSEENLFFRFNSDAADIYLYADKDGAQPIDTIKHEGGTAFVSVLGKYASLDNQIASVWADKEVRTSLVKDVDLEYKTLFIREGLLLASDNSVMLNSFDLKVSTLTSRPDTVKVTPVLYVLKMDESHHGRGYIVDSLTWKGKPQAFIADDEKGTVITVECGVPFVAGKKYLLGMESNVSVSVHMYACGNKKDINGFFESPVLDEKSLGIRWIGSTSISYESLNEAKQNCYFNLDFSQMSSLGCEMVELKSVVKETEHVGVDDVEAYDASEIVDVYTPTGLLVKKSVTRVDALKGLPKGVYIVGNAKAVKFDD